MPPPRLRLALLVTICMLAAVARCGAALWWQSRLPQGQKFVFADSHTYWYLAQRLARGQSYQYGGEELRIFRTPGYPVLLAGMLVIVGDTDPPVISARLLGAGLGTLTVCGLAWLAWHLFGECSAYVAGLLAACYPEAVAMSILVLSEAPFCPLMVAQLLCWTYAWHSRRKPALMALSFAGGVAAGLATLVRPSWLLFTPFAWCVSLWVGSRRRQQLWIGGMMMAGLAITMLPWWVRNYQVTGRFVPTTLQVGASLYDGLNPQATGGSNMEFATRFFQQLKAEQASGGQSPDVFEVQLDRRLRQSALEWAGRNPRRVVQLMLVKFQRMWNVWPNDAELRSGAMRWVVMAAYLPLLAGGLAGAWLFCRRGWPYVLCVLPAVYFTGLHLIFVSSIRYRQPAMLLLLVLAAGVVGRWWSDAGAGVDQGNATCPQGRAAGRR